MENLLKPNGKASDAILLADKIDFKLKLIIKNKEHFIIMKGMINQEYIIILNTYSPNSGAINFIKRILLELKRLISIQ